jgi:hypothetical protein
MAAPKSKYSHSKAPPSYNGKAKVDHTGTKNFTAQDWARCVQSLCCPPFAGLWDQQSHEHTDKCPGSPCLLVPKPLV